MYKIFIGSALFVLFIAADAFPQYQKQFKAPTPFAAVGMFGYPTADGGFIITGSTDNGAGFFLLKTDANGAIIWDKKYTHASGPSSRFVQELSGGGYIIAGWGGSGLFLVKTDASGNILWSKTAAMSAPAGYGFLDARQTADGGFVIAACAAACAGGGQDVIFKYDANGVKQWATGWGYAFANFYSMKAIQTSDGGYNVVGADGANLFLAQFTSAGALSWIKTYLSTGSSFTTGYGHTQTSDGGFLVTGRRWNGANNDLYVLKTDVSGNVSWSKYYDGGLAISEDGYFVKQTADGGYIIYGSISPIGGQAKNLTMKINSTGVLSWAKYYQNKNNSGGAIYEIGSNYYFFDNKGSDATVASALMVTLDASGNSGGGCPETSLTTTTTVATTTASVPAPGTYAVAGGTLGAWAISTSAWSPTTECCPAAGTPGAITGSSSVCSAQSGVAYSIGAVAGATSYTWSVPAGASVTAGQGTTSATVTFGGSSGNVSVTANNACGNSAASNLAITVNSTPAIPGAITGNTTVCANSASEGYSIASVSGATSYTWSIPVGWTINSGQGTTAMNATATGTGGSICVNASNACGTSANNCMAVTVPSNGGIGTWTWQGTISTDWFNPCNWDKKSLPDASSDVLIPVAVTNPPTIGTTGAACYTLTVDGSTVLTITPVSGALNVAKP